MTEPLATFVGRAAELAQLESVLGEAERGTARVVLLEGEPGIGKTRLCDELCRRARERGFSLARGAALMDAGAPALAPFRAIARSVGPELRALLDADAFEPHAAVDDARFRRFEAAAELLVQKSQTRPLLVALDDLHDADQASLELVLFCARNVREARLMLIATVRTAITRVDNTHDALLTRIARDALVLPIGPLAVDDVRALTAEAHVPPAQLARIHALTHGNPLFIGELCMQLRAGGSASEVRVPSSMASALRSKLAQLSAPARAFVEAAAVLGGAPGLPGLARLLEVSLDGILARVAEPVHAGVLVDDGSLRVRFAHPLLREIVLEDLPRESRARLHLACAQTLEAMASDGHDISSVEIAHHRASALPLGDAREALTWLARAADEADRKLAVEEAAQLTGRAVEIAGWAVLTPVERCDLTLAHARARARAGARGQAREAATRALSLAEAAHDPRRLALAALARGADFSLGVVDAGLVQALEAAQAALDAHEHAALLARVEARLAAARQPSRDPSEPLALARRALARARSVDDAAARLDTYISAGSALADYAPLPERIALSREIVQLSLELGQKPLALRGHLRLALDQLESADASAADLSIQSYAAIAATLKAPQYHWTHPLLIAMRSAMCGRLDEAEQLAAEGLRIGERSEDPNARIAYWLQRIVRLREFSDDMESTEHALRMVHGLFDGTVIELWTSVIRASIHARRGEAEPALRSLQVLPSSHPALRMESTVVAMALEVCAEQAQPDLQLVELLLEAARARGEACLSWGVLALSWDAPWQRYVGLGELARGELDEAVRAFEAARELSTTLGALPAHTRISHDLARALEARQRGDDRARAAALRGEVRERAQALGMRGLHARVVRELARQVARPGKAEKAPPDDLTVRRAGEMFVLGFAGTELCMRESRGLSMLAQLVEARGRELHVLELSGVTDPEARADAGEAVDAQAIDSYRLRAQALREQIEEAEQNADLHRAERAREELDALSEELSRSVGAFGRARRAGSNSERARVNVQCRLKDVIERARASAPALAAHLERSLKTGTFCSYRP